MKINHKRKVETFKYLNLNNMSLNNYRVNEDIKKEICKSMKINGNEVHELLEHMKNQGVTRG